MLTLQSLKRGRNLVETQGRHNLKSNLRKSGQDKPRVDEETNAHFLFLYHSDADRFVVRIHMI